MNKLLVSKRSLNLNSSSLYQSTRCAATSSAKAFKAGLIDKPTGNVSPLLVLPSVGSAFYCSALKNLTANPFAHLDKTTIAFSRFYSQQSANNQEKQHHNDAKEEPTGQKNKKTSKFKALYTQYGPTFLIVHLTTVVMWIYGFFLISKQGYDITNLLDVMEKVDLISANTVRSMHEKIDNYEVKSGWISGNDIKHFATAYMVYKVIAPFRYVVSIAIVKVVVTNLRRKGLMKST